ncbi:MAG: hypothetical protein LBV75_00670, partial [Paludibacter sp.]|nr:hypothetical protein [Paludibacter sp.]
PNGFNPENLRWRGYRHIGTSLAIRVLTNTNTQIKNRRERNVAFVLIVYFRRVFLSYCLSVHIKERLRLINKQEDRKAERHFFIYVISFYLIFLSHTR